MQPHFHFRRMANKITPTLYFTLTSLPRYVSFISSIALSSTYSFSIPTGTILVQVFIFLEQLLWPTDLPPCLQALSFLIYSKSAIRFP